MLVGFCLLTLFCYCVCGDFFPTGHLMVFSFSWFVSIPLGRSCLRCFEMFSEQYRMWIYAGFQPIGCFRDVIPAPILGCAKGLEEGQRSKKSPKIWQSKLGVA